MIFNQSAFVNIECYSLKRQAAFGKYKENYGLSTFKQGLLKLAFQLVVIATNMSRWLMHSKILLRVSSQQ